MQKPNDKIAVLLIIFVSFFCLSQAWGSDSKTIAPEPNTLALFSGGLLTMLIAFFRRTYSLTKRTIDITGSVIALIVFSPVLLLTALLIKLTSKGPVFFTQTRVGKDGQHFEIYKFRTMNPDAEK